MPAINYLLLVALAGGWLLGRRREVRVPWFVLVPLYALLFYRLSRLPALGRIGAGEIVTIGCFVNAVAILATCVLLVAQLCRCRGLAPRERVRRHIVSLAIFAAVMFWCGPVGRLLIAYSLSLTPGVIAEDGTVRQTTGVSCGPCSLATALRWHGERVNERETVRACGTSFAGTTIWRLQRGARERGYVMAPVDSPLSSASTEDLPIVSVVNIPGLGVPHCVAFTRADTESLYMADPAGGGRWVKRSEAESMRFGAWYSVRKNPAMPRGVQQGSEQVRHRHQPVPRGEVDQPSLAQSLSRRTS